MSRGNIATTATLAGFRREDISFHNARRQSEIENEIEKTVDTPCNVEVPLSTTPEQVIEYFRECIEVEDDREKRHLYLQTVRYIEKMMELNKQLVKYKSMEIVDKNKNEIKEENVDE